VTAQLVGTHSLRDEILIREHPREVLPSLVLLPVAGVCVCMAVNSSVIPFRSTCRQFGLWRMRQLGLIFIHGSCGDAGRQKPLSRFPSWDPPV